MLSSSIVLNSAIPSPNSRTPTLPTLSSLAPPQPMQERRSSLLISRRRAGTEEPPDDGRRSSLLLRTRRAGTEEPESSSHTLSSHTPRKPSLLMRPRQGTVGEEDEDGHFRLPSRAATEVAPPSRALSRDYSSPGADPGSLTPSALPRRRLHNSPAINTRFGASPAAGSVRRFGENGDIPERPEREIARPYSIGQAAALNRTTSARRPGVGGGPSQVGSYR